MMFVCYFFIRHYTTVLLLSFFFFFNDTATTDIYTLSLHDALPISSDESSFVNGHALVVDGGLTGGRLWSETEQRRVMRSEEHTSELQSLTNLVCRLLLEKKNNLKKRGINIRIS